MRSHLCSLATALAVGVVVSSCGGSDESGAPETSSASSDAPEGTGCVILLHGKGMDGAATTESDGRQLIAPSGNAEAWGGREWRYFPENEFEEARAVVADAADGCDEVVLGGFSNGAAFAAKLYCRGEDLDGRLRTVVIDDPVTDAGVEGCEPDPSVAAALYWTGALEGDAPVGTDCAELDWTCEGGKVIGIEAYEEALGITAADSPLDEHAWYLDAPELAGP